MLVTVSSSPKALLTSDFGLGSKLCARSLHGEQFSSLNAGKQIIVLLCFITFKMLLVEHPDPRFWPLQTLIEEFAV